MASAMGLAEIRQYSDSTQQKLLNDMHILHILLIQK